MVRIVITGTAPTSMNNDQHIHGRRRWAKIFRRAFSTALFLLLGWQGWSSMIESDKISFYKDMNDDINFSQSSWPLTRTEPVPTTEPAEYSVALYQSYGLLNDTSNAEWTTLRHHTTHTSWYADANNPLYLVENATDWNLHNMIPNFDCPNVMGMGNPRSGESKYVCNPQRLTYPNKSPDCLIYSFGCAGDYSWEDSVVRMHPNRECEIHVFDPAPSFKRAGDVEDKNIHYHAWGLLSTYDNSKSVVWPKGRGGGFKTFPETLELLGHQNRTIDILKIDCEGCEWSTIHDWINLDIRQILIETHGVPTPTGTPEARWYQKPLDITAWYQNYIDNGYALFHKEMNGGLSLELCFIKLHPDFWRKETGKVTDHPRPTSGRALTVSSRPLSMVSAALETTSPASNVNVDQHKSTVGQESSMSSWSADVQLLTELTTRENETLSCPPHLIPYHNRIVAPQNDGVDPLIPRFLHITERSRCLSPDMYHAMKVWEEHFPSYSVFFHDDEAVERLLSMDWPEFPDFHRMLNCVVQGAMKIDIWRLVVLWRFGGMYTDNDMLPSSNFTDDTIHPEASFFSLSDGSDRPSQWLFASTPRHPVYNRTLPIITRKVLDIRNIAKPRVVFTTGPQVLFEGWQEVFGNTTRVGNNTNMLRSPDGLLVQRYWKHRDEYEQFLNRTYWGDEVPCNRKCSNRMHISRKERNQIDAGRVHWQKDTFQGTTGRPSVSCAQYLDSLQKTN